VRVIVFFCRFIVLFLFCVCCFSVLSHAQSVPSSADASRFDERFERPVLNKDNRIEPPQSINATSPIPEAEDGFVLKSISLTGMTVFTQEDFQGMIDEYIGRSVDFNVLTHLTGRITARYRAQGYFLSAAIIPQQEVEGGRVTIQVLEGYVHGVIIDDPKNILKSDHGDITQKTAAAIESLDPLHGPSLERYMLLLNESAGVQVSSILDAAFGAPKPGGVNITLSVEGASDAWMFGYNNHGSRFVGASQVDAAYITGGVLNAYDTLTLQGVAAIPWEESRHGSIFYTLPVHENGLKFETSISQTGSRPGLNLEVLEVESDSFSWKGGLSYPYLRSRRDNVTLDVSLTVKNTATEFLDEELIDDKIRFLTLGASYNGQSDGGHLNSARFAVQKGFDIFGATKTGSANLSRSQGESDFVKFTGAVSRLQNIPDASLSVLGQVEGQYSPNPLLSSAEFGYGGSRLGRAYDSSEITGDSGISAGLEVRYNGFDPIKNTLFLTPFAFYDIGKVWNKDNNTDPISAASAGFGAYYQVAHPISGSVSVAYPLTKSVATPVMGGENGPRILFDLNVRF
jgi:hemolysin activation/secretion protein